MTKSPPLTLQQLATRLDEQALETATLRSALDLQFRRVAQMQAQLDALPAARKRREARAAQVLRIASQNGNGHRPR